MKKYLALLLALTMVFTLAACGNKAQEKPAETAEVETPTETPVESASADNKFEQIKASGKLIVGTAADYPPYAFHIMENGQDKIVGFDMDLGQALADEWGVELEIQDMDFSAVLSGVQTGLIDVGIAGINPSPERAETMDFSDVYFESGYCVLVRAEDAANFTTEADLNGKAIGVQTGTVQEGIVAENVEASNVVSLGKVTDLVMQLQAGMIDAIVVEVPVADSYAKNNPDVVAVEEIDFKEIGIEGGSVVVTAKGEAELIAAINEAIAKFQGEDKFNTWYTEAVELNDAQGEQ